MQCCNDRKIKVCQITAELDIFAISEKMIKHKLGPYTAS